jgi:hypothetical protein
MAIKCSGFENVLVEVSNIPGVLRLPPRLRLVFTAGVASDTVAVAPDLLVVDDRVADVDVDVDDEATLFRCLFLGLLFFFSILLLLLW